MKQAPGVNRISLRLALLLALVSSAHGTIMIPQSQWGPGQGYVQANVPNYHGEAYCYVQATTPSTCTENISSNLPPQFPDYNTGTSYGTLSASTDGNGAHLYASGSGSGESTTYVTGLAFFNDVLTNSLNVPVEFQLTFHVDATLFSRSSSTSEFDVSFQGNYANASLFSQQISYGGAGTYAFVDQDVTTALYTVAPNSTFVWGVSMNAQVSSSTIAGATYLAGYPSAYLDASNTLSLQTLSVFDAQGNPLPVSTLSSYDGYSYADTSSVPEPATAALFGGAFVAFALVGRRRISTSF